MITALVYGGVWSRDGLSLRDRSLVTLAVHIARERPEEMRIHIPVGLRNGLTKAEIEELFIQVGAYAGFPAAANCNRVAQEVFAGLDAGPGQASASDEDPSS
jgi:alkylhydroperoxidase/carboxymuconolactone decarboxylase family protein YurZ